MTDAFREALAYVLPGEADRGDLGIINVDTVGPRVTDDPDDRGGRTNDGITQEDYDDYRKRHGLEIRSVDFMSVGERNAIYLEDDWTPNRLDEMPRLLALAIFDFSVHSGRSRAAKTLQRVIGAKPDGAIGPKTMEALEGALRTYSVPIGEGRFAIRLSGAAAVAWKVIDDRNELFSAIIRNRPDQSKFALGWFRRTTKLAALVAARGV